MQVREQLDFATILYNKGLHKQSLKVLDKAKAIALSNEDSTLAFSIVELEKVVESQYITRSLSSRADDLILQSKDLGEKTLMLSKLSNLSLQLYSMLLKRGYVSNDKDFEEVRAFFRRSLPEYDIQKLGIIEKLYLYKAYLWYNFIVQDFVSGYRYAQKWVDLFYYNPEMKKTNPVFYLKGINYLLEVLFLVQHLTKFRSTLLFFEEELNKQNFLINENTESLAFLYLYLNKINLYFLEGNFNRGLSLIPEVLERDRKPQIKN